MLRTITTAALLALIVGVAGAVELPLEEGFERSLDEMRAEGWVVRSSASLSDENPRSGDQCLRMDVGDEQSARYMELYIPVETGKQYSAEAWIRTEGVESHPRGGSNRGAVVFLQWATHERAHVSGGSFPRGLRGDNDWTRHEVSFTWPIPGNVGYVQLLLGIEGQGTAWFDDVVIREVQPGWIGPEILEPAADATVPTRRPLIEWNDLSPGGAGYVVEFSQDPAFPEAATLSVEAEGTTARPPAWLEPGEWHYRIIAQMGRDRTMPPARSHSFVVAAEAIAWPPDVTPRWEWSDQPRPEMAVAIGPEGTEAEVAVTINEQPVEVIERGQYLLRFRPAADLEEGIHEVRIEATGVGEPVVHDAIFCNKQPGSVVTFREDRMTLIDGEPFFPLGTYRDPSDSITEVAGLLEAGFNLTHDYLFEHAPQTVETARAYLDLLDEHGIKTFLGISRAKLHDGDLAWVQRFVAELMDHPALLTWYLMDEPEIRGMTSADMRRVHEAVRMVDPFHPTSVVYCRPNAFDEWADAQDIHWNDPYPLRPEGADRPLTMVADWVKLGRDAVGPDRPVWTVLQGHDYRWRNVEQAWAEFGVPDKPTREQTRAMTFLALAEGTDGLIWYWWPKSRYHIVDDAPEKWQGIVDTVQLLNEMMPWLTAERTAADEMVAPEPFRVWSREADGVRLVAVINDSDEDAQLRVPLPEGTAGRLLDYETGEAVELPGGELQAEFAPWEVKIYRW
ncbi:MAG: hypothetical protein ACOX9R_09560 [Armatimonadota bacterium]|jgi:hypothetical protein